MKCPKCNGECLETKWVGIGIVYICKCCHEIWEIEKMKKIYIGYSDFTNSLYCFSKKDNSDKQDVTKHFVNIVRNICKLNDTKEIKIGDLLLQIKEIEK